jgi:hypothetical protein
MDEEVVLTRRERGRDWASTLMVKASVAPQFLGLTPRESEFIRI